MKEKDEHVWWQKEIIYQIYPRSFYDSNGDGIGDIPGIIEKLDYLQELGIRGVWVSPIYPSPMVDFGYDITDYTGIHPMFGTMEDFERLVEQIHARDMKLILDFVPNHTSEEHPWFRESRQSRDNPRRDWYIWRDPKYNGGPPNNWESEFGGSAWEYDEQTGQYYYHAFLKEQPDLNWRNPEVQQAMLDVMRFWLDKGVDGFRIDSMWHLIKDEQFRDDPVRPDYNEDMSTYDKLVSAYSADQPEVHKVTQIMRNLTDKYGERVLIYEIYLPIHKLVVYYGLNNEGAHLPFNFRLVEMPWDAREIEAVINEYEGSLPAGSWPNWVLGNHDQPRIVSRVGLEQARIAAMLLLTLRGTPIMYYGDELGMANVPIPEEQVKDPSTKNAPGAGPGRDPERTPMQWDSSKNAGFTEGKPWLPLMENYEEINVAKQRDVSHSMLNFYRRLIDLRSKERALNVGNFFPLLNEGSLLSYRRIDAEKEFIVALNLGGSEETFIPDMPDWKGIVRFSTHKEAEGKEISGEVKLKPNQGLVIELLRKLS